MNLLEYVDIIMQAPQEEPENTTTIRYLVQTNDAKYMLVSNSTIEAYKSLYSRWYSGSYNQIEKVVFGKIFAAVNEEDFRRDWEYYYVQYCFSFRNKLGCDFEYNVLSQYLTIKVDELNTNLKIAIKNAFLEYEKSFSESVYKISIRSSKCLVENFIDCIEKIRVVEDIYDDIKRATNA